MERNRFLSHDVTIPRVAPLRWARRYHIAAEAAALFVNIGSYSGADGSRWHEMARAGVFGPADPRPVAAPVRRDRQPPGESADPLKGASRTAFFCGRVATGIMQRGEVW
jgi:hypothetical protein